MYISRKAFTFIEMILVMIVLGIVASIGASIISQTYQSYLMQKAIHAASFKSELAVNSIANRLAYRIDISAAARKPGQSGYTVGTDIYPLISIPESKKAEFNILEWIGYDNDGFSNSNSPGWSGFADLDLSSFGSIVSTGSNGSTETTILANLDLNGSLGLMFKGSQIYRNDTNASYNTSCMYASGSSSCMFPVSINGNTISFSGGDRQNGQMEYSEFYQLAATAYSIVPINKHQINNVWVWDLELHSNYQPWDGEDYTQAGTKSIIARNVSVFRFTQEPNSIRLKICTVSQIGNGDQGQISICKEKAVIR